jgi:hypothetical protein
MLPPNRFAIERGKTGDKVDFQIPRRLRAHLRHAVSIRLIAVKTVTAPASSL